MKLLKRYIEPFFLGLVVYTVLCTVFGLRKNGFFPGLCIVLLFAYLIRISDDIADYREDFRMGKPQLPMGALIGAEIGITGFICLFALQNNTLLFFIPIVLIVSQFAVPKRYRDIIKPLFMPAVAASLMDTVLNYNTLTFMITAILMVVFDIILITGKRKKDDSDKQTR